MLDCDGFETAPNVYVMSRKQTVSRKYIILGYGRPLREEDRRKEIVNLI